MSETVEEVQTETVTEPITKKDPKRVEQGKRLAAISKQAKEEKMRKKINEENFSYFPYAMYSVAILSSLGLLYMFFKKPSDDPHPMTVIRESPQKQKTPPPKKKNFVGFD